MIYLVDQWGDIGVNLERGANRIMVVSRVFLRGRISCRSTGGGGRHGQPSLGRVVDHRSPRYKGYLLQLPSHNRPVLLGPFAALGSEHALPCRGQLDCADLSVFPTAPQPYGADFAGAGLSCFPSHLSLGFCAGGGHAIFFFGFANGPWHIALASRVKSSSYSLQLWITSLGGQWDTFFSSGHSRSLRSSSGSSLSCDTSKRGRDTTKIKPMLRCVRMYIHHGVTG